MPPIVRDQSKLAKRLDVRWQAQGNDVGGQAVPDSPGLARRAAVRLPNADGSAGFTAHAARKLRVYFTIDFARRIIGNIEQLHGLTHPGIPADPEPRRS